MSDTSNGENSQLDSQATFYDNDTQSPDIQHLDNKQSMNESQDFHLVVDSAGSSDLSVNRTDVEEDGGDVQCNKNPQHQAKDVEEMETEPVEVNKTLSGTEIGAKPCPDMVESNEMIAESAKNVSKEKITDDDIKKKNHDTDVEKEIIPGTPPPPISPSKKFFLTALTPGKRKAEAIDEPVCKIPRTHSEKDALKLDRKVLEARTDNTNNTDKELNISEKESEEKESKTNIFYQDTQAMDVEEESLSSIGQSETQRDVIIPESQEIADSESMSQEIVQSSVDTLEKNIEGNDSNGHLKESDQLLQFSSSSESQKNASQESHSTDDLFVVTIKETQSESSFSGDKTNEIEMEVSLLENGSNRRGQKQDQVSSSKASERSNKSKETDLAASDKTINSKIDPKEFEITAENSSLETLGLTETDTKKDEPENKRASPRANSDNNVSSWKKDVLPIHDSGSNSGSGTNSTIRSRMSIEVIFDGKPVSSKPTEFVEIDEEGEKIVLDSSHDDYQLRFSQSPSHDNTNSETNHKTFLKTKSNSDSCYELAYHKDSKRKSDISSKADSQLINGDSDGTEKTASMESDMLEDNAFTFESNKKPQHSTLRKLAGNLEVINISDSEGDNSINNENSKKKSPHKTNESVPKTIPVQKKIKVYMELHCLMHMDENTKEYLTKEFLDVHCETVVEPSIQRRYSDASTCLADVSGNDNKEASPGSVTSNTQPYTLNPSRLSLMSTISSSSSGSSAASLAAKLAMKEMVHFSLPRGPAKHARKQLPSGNTTDTQSDEAYEQLIKQWKNAPLALVHLLSLPEFQNEGEHVENIEEKIISSTPEPLGNENNIVPQTITPKRGRPKKKDRGKSTGSLKKNGLTKVSPELVSTSLERISSASSNQTKPDESMDSAQPELLTPTKVTVSTPVRTSARSEAMRSLTPQNLPNEEILGKQVFAKWSDNNYYPGKVTEKVKEKYKVNFYDGKSKLLIEEFIIPMPKILNNGMSVYATTKDDDYGSCGIIFKAEPVKNVVYYTVETDEGERIRVQTKDLFLTPDQAQVLKEESTIETKSLPQTPQHLGQVSLDNLVEGKRRSRRATTPSISTPKSRKEGTPRTIRLTAPAIPSVSGVPKAKEKEKTAQGKEKTYSESDGKTSDSGTSILGEVWGVQPELITTPSEQITKGPPSRMKGRGRSKPKQTEDPETIAMLGPIPSATSNIFKNLSFILTCTDPDVIAQNHMGTDDSNSETGTENEEEWIRTPFVRDRIKKQIIAGGGRVFDSFELIPKEEYNNTKLITNIPNLTAKSLQCLSVGIAAYNHKLIVCSCLKNKLVNPDEYKLPAGWSLAKRSYVEMFQRRSNSPLTGVVVVIPNVNNISIKFWRPVCENAGGVVIVVDNPDQFSGDFSDRTVVVTNDKCPSWIVENAEKLQIPLVSTTWISQCLILGDVLDDYDSQPRYKHDYIQS